MENPKFDPQSEVVKMAIENLVSGREMSVVSRGTVFEIAVSQAQSFVESKSEEIFGYEGKDDEVKKHLAAIVLDRIMSLRPQGTSTTVFSDLK